MRMKNRFCKMAKDMLIVMCFVSFCGAFNSCKDEYTLDDERPVFQDGQRRGQVDGGGGLTDPAFLVGNGNDLSHNLQSYEKKPLNSRCQTLES